MPITSPINRSQITNGSRLHQAGVDGRSAEARRWRDLYQAFVDASGGPDEAAVHRMQLCRRAATLAILAEGEEARLVRGKPVDEMAYVRATGSLRRVLLALGLEPSDNGITHSASPIKRERSRSAMDFPEIDPSFLTDEERSTLVRLIEKATPKQHG